MPINNYIFKPYINLIVFILVDYFRGETTKGVNIGKDLGILVDQT